MFQAALQSECKVLKDATDKYLKTYIDWKEIEGTLQHHKNTSSPVRKGKFKDILIPVPC